MKWTFIFFLLLGITFVAEAYELIMIQAVSSSKTTFITRHGRREGLTEGVTATFTANDVSIIAKAINVKGDFTQWQIQNQNLKLPFEKGAIVTYYQATEYLWTLSPEAERQKYIKTVVAKPKHSVGIKGSITRGVSDTLSDAPVNSSVRGAYTGDLFYEWEFAENFSWDIALRYESEVTSFSSGSTLTTRALLMMDFYAYFDQLKDIIGGRIYAGIGAGYGYSSTSAVTLTQAGPVTLLPSFKLGLNLPFSDEWSFLIDGGIESLQTKEKQEAGTVQSSNQLNVRGAIGLRRHF